MQLLLESGALCERDTFQGERCLYNALNDRIRRLLLEYDYSKSTDPLQPLASHITSLLIRTHPHTSDIVVTSTNTSFNLHRFVLSARSPYFRKKLSHAPETTSWRLPPSIPPQAFDIAIRYIYLGEIPSDVGGGAGTGFSEEDVLQGLDKISKQLEILSLWDGVLAGGDRRLSRQRRIDEVEKGRDQLEQWFEENIMKHKVLVDTSKAGDIKWDRENGIFADALLKADDPEGSFEQEWPSGAVHRDPTLNTTERLGGIPVGPSLQSTPSSQNSNESRSTLFPVHRAMLIRSDFFTAMFSSAFREAQLDSHLPIIPIDCSSDVLKIVLRYLYTEKADFPLEIAVDVLFAADLLFIEKLKVKAAVIISTLGNGSISSGPINSEGASQDAIDIYEVIRAGWLTRVPRLESFAARYFAYRLEHYIDEPDFADLIRESAGRIKGRQETDSIELLDDIRYYLSERFRLRFEDLGLEDDPEEDFEVLAKPVLAEHVPGLPNCNKSGPLRENGDTEIDSSINTQASQTIGDPQSTTQESQLLSGAVRTLDGEIAGDEFASDAINYQILLGKIDSLLEDLKLDA